jgi:hypothetical protein
MHTYSTSRLIARNHATTPPHVRDRDLYLYIHPPSQLSYPKALVQTPHLFLSRSTLPYRLVSMNQGQCSTLTLFSHHHWAREPADLRAALSRSKEAGLFFVTGESTLRCMVHALFLLQQENTSVQVGLVALDDRPLCRIEKREKVTSFAYMYR